METSSAETGSTPHAAYVTPDGRYLWVIDFLGRLPAPGDDENATFATKVAIFDLETNEVVHEISSESLNQSFGHITIPPDGGGDTAYISAGAGTVVAYDIHTYEQVGFIITSGAPYSVHELRF